jgi:hypothetical protein
MSSTKTPDSIPETLRRALEERLRRFYRRSIVGLEVTFAQEGRERVSEESFWIRRNGASPTPEDFELQLGDDLDMALTLELFWAGTVLSGLGTPLARLARRFPREKKGEVSSFVYEMF